MKNFLSAIMLFAMCIAQAQNPWEKYGYTPPKPLTLSNGQYVEFFENDTVVQIGSVLFNTVTNQVVAFLETDTIYSEATLKPEVISRFLSPDPLEKEFPELSPYQYASNSPIANIDLDGLEANLAIFAKEGGRTQDLNAFNARAAMITSKNANITAHGILTGKDFVELLKTKTKDEGSIQSFVIFSHSISEGVVLKTASGFYRTGSIFGGSNSDAQSTSDVTAAIKSGEIKFEPGAVALFGGCNCANEKQYTQGMSLAKNFAQETGVTTIGALGDVIPEVYEGKETGRLISSGFVKFEMGENGNLIQTSLGGTINPESIINPIQKMEPIQVKQINVSE